MDDLLDRAPCGFAVVGDDGIVQLANTTLLTMLGYAREAVVGQHIDRWLPIASRIFYQTHVFPLLRLQSCVAEVYLTLRKSGGSDVPVLLNAERRHSGAEISNQYVFVPVPQRKLFEAELIAARKAAEAASQAEATARQALAAERAALAERVAERTAQLAAANADLVRAARLKDEFLASMSHELRTPLNAILGYSQALSDDVYGALSGPQARAVQRIEESGRHLLQLVGDMLDLARLGADQIAIDLAVLSVADVCHSSLAAIAGSAREKQLRVAYTCPSHVRWLWADARRLKQILGNLLSNAVKFTPEGGTIGLDVAGDQAMRSLTLTVWDTGIGIAAERHRELFQPFVQLDGRLAREYEGAGLGLALVDGLVRLHGGSVAVESAPGAGSRFMVQLPWPPELQGSQPALDFADVVR